MESNARLTASTAVVLFVLLAVEGVTILRLRPLLSVHVFIGMVLVHRLRRPGGPVADVGPTPGTVMDRGPRPA